MNPIMKYGVIGMVVIGAIAMTIFIATKENPFKEMKRIIDLDVKRINDIPILEVQLPDGQAQTPVNMSGNFLLYHFNNITDPIDNMTRSYDYSGSGNNGTPTNFDGDEVVTGAFGKAFDLHLNDFVNTTKQFSLLSTGTIAMWINLTGFSGSTDYAIASNYDGGAFSNGEWLIYLNNDRDLEAFMGATGFVQTNYSSGGYDNKQFHHVAVTWKANEVILYIDGIAKNTDTAMSSSVFGYTKHNLIGRDNDAAASPVAFRPFNGTIDDVGFWNRTLTGDEIASIIAEETNPPSVFYITPNESIYTIGSEENFTVNISDAESDIASADFYMNFRGRGDWRIEHTNTTSGESPKIYNFSFNFTDWFDSLDTVASVNLTSANGFSIEGNDTYLFTVAYQDDIIKWVNRSSGENVTQYPTATTWIVDLAYNGTDFYAIDLLVANPIQHIYINGTVRDSCAISGAGTGGLDGIAFDDDDTTLWVSDSSGSPNVLEHYYPNCTFIENISIPLWHGDTTGLDIDSSGLAYLWDASTNPDQIIIIDTNTGINDYNITSVRTRMGQSADPIWGVYVEETEGYPERIFMRGSNGNEISYIQRRGTGSMIWNVEGCDASVNCAFNSTNQTYYFSNPTPADCWTKESNLLIIPNGCVYHLASGGEDEI